MGTFSNNAITDAGRMLLADVQAGAIFTPTRIVMGSGNMPSGTTAQEMTNVIKPVKTLTISKKTRTPDGKCVFGGVYNNKEVTEPFYFRELALYAKAVYLNEDGSVKSESAETLYSYGNAGATADYMPAYSTSTVVEKEMDLVTWVGNNAQVDLTIESGVYVTQKQAVLNVQFIRPDTVGYDSLLEYMASIYPQNVIVVGNISGFSDMPEGVTTMHGMINVVGTLLTVFGSSRLGFYSRGTNSLTAWTNEWRVAYDGSTDLTIEKTTAALHLLTQSGSSHYYKNANTTTDHGTIIADETTGGVTDRINFSAARPLSDKLRLILDNDETYKILHTGNKELITPADIGALADAGGTLSGDLQIEKSIASLKLITPKGTTNINRNANATADNGTMIVDQTLDGKTANLVISATNRLETKLLLMVDGVTTYTVVHTGNMATLGIGVVPASIE